MLAVIGSVYWSEHLRLASVPQSPAVAQPRQTVTVHTPFTGAPRANQACLTQAAASRI